MSQTTDAIKTLGDDLTARLTDISTKSDALIALVKSSSAGTDPAVLDAITAVESSFDTAADAVAKKIADATTAVTTAPSEPPAPVQAPSQGPTTPGS